VTGSPTPETPRRLSQVDAKRMVLVLAIMLAATACNWLLLAAIQWLIIPKATGGKDGPWVIRPILALHFGGAAVMAAFTLPVILMPMKRRWKRADAESGTRYDPFHNRPVKRIIIFVQGTVLLFVYGACLVFYLLSWTTIGPDGITERVPWGTRHHSFKDIESLERIPDGMRSEALTQNGPWYNIKLRGDRRIDLSLDNEGVTLDDLTAMTDFVAVRSGRSWATRSDARARSR
jgi:hypothetical protein